MAAPVLTRHSPVRIPALDGIRGLAIAVVMISHAWSSLPGSWLSSVGVNGVDLFFVLSGFLITRGLTESKGDQRYFRDFWVKRMLRLSPLYFAYLAVCALIMPALHRMVGTSMVDYPGPWWPFVAYVNNWTRLDHVPVLSHLWSLAIEEQFYFAWPFIVLLLSTRRLAWTCAAIMAGGFCLRLALQDHGWALLYFNTFTRIDLMAAGALISTCDHLPALERAVNRSVMPVVTVAALGLTALSATGHLAYTDPVFRVYGQVCVLLLCAVAVYRTAYTAWAPALFTSGPMRWLGERSYCIYLVHMQILWHTAWIASAIGKRRPELTVPAFAAAAILGVSASLIVAALSWRYVEKPVMGFRKRLLVRDKPATISAPVEMAEITATYSKHLEPITTVDAAAR